VIRNASLELNAQSRQTSEEELRTKLENLFKSGSGGTVQPSTSEEHTQEQDETATKSRSTTSSSTGYLVLPSSEGQPRLPNNAYDALREYTEGLKKDGLSAGDILDRQLKLLGRLPIFKDEVQRIKDSLKHDTQPELSQTARDRLMLRLPAAAINAQIKSNAAQPPLSSTSTAPSSSTQQPALPVSPPTQTSTTTSSNKRTTDPPSSNAAESSDRQRAQQNEYRQMQREREQKQREERERIKAQIKADREERRRREQVQKQNDQASSSSTTANPEANSHTAPPRPSPTETRVQVRTFDGSVLRSTFTPMSTITADLRPWIDSEISPNLPYDFKLILTPQPNKKIEASEEGLALRDLGVKGSCTFVIAPVKGFVDSYSGGSAGIVAGGAGLVGGVVSGGFNLVTGTAGAVLGGVGRMFGFGAGAGGSVGEEGQRQRQQLSGQDDQQQQQGSRATNVRVRTLADQRADEANRRGNQFYNGNTLNFEPNRDAEKDERKQD
jgi:hypothetical protein